MCQSADERNDYVRMLPPIVVSGRAVKLEVEVHGAWVEDRYEPRKERSPDVVMAIRRMWELVEQGGRIL